MLKKISTLLPLLIASVAITACSGTRPQNTQTKKPVTKAVNKSPAKLKAVPVVYEKRSPRKHVAKKPVKRLQRSAYANSFDNKLSNAALARLGYKVRYDGAYVKLAYPWGDVPPHTGVCTDVVIRSYRALGIDLQQQVHLDMSAAFHEYPNPKAWGLSKPDANIDHRRVHNLRKFFERRGAALPITRDARNYKPGDLVTWMVGSHLPHIGIVVNKRSKADPNRFMIVHNIAHGPQIEDILFKFRITGHYRYTPAHMGNIPKGIYTQKDNKGMSYQQLVQAANILGTNKNTVAQTRRKAKPQARRTNERLLDQVVRLNQTDKLRAKSRSVNIANLSDSQLQTLLKR